MAAHLREVRIVGICGASATGKSELANRLVEALQSPVNALSADWYFCKPRNIKPCRKCPQCWEQVSSVNLDGLALDLGKLTNALATAPSGPVPEISFGHSAHNVCGISGKNPARIDRAGVTLTHEPVVVVVDGFLLFANPSVCEMLHAGIFLLADDVEMLARRRFQRQGGCLEDAAAWAEARDEYVQHIYEHHLRAQPGMLEKARAILHGKIKITESTTVDGMVSQAKALLLEGGAANAPQQGAGGAADGGEGAALDGHAIGSPSSSKNAFDSPVIHHLPPCTPPRGAGSSTAPPSSVKSPAPAILPAASPTSVGASSNAAFSAMLPQPTATTPELTLAALPPGSHVAVLDFLGSFCPVTTGHVQCMIEARRILLGEAPPANDDGALAPYAACLCALNVNDDIWVREKLSRSGEDALSAQQRLQLCDLATASEAAWVRVGTSAEAWVASLRSSCPSIRVTVWSLNGADDVVRYKKWECASKEWPFITMGRPGDTATILAAIHNEGLRSDAFVLGPELPDVSSTVARNALSCVDHATLAACLHPDVATWLKQHGPYQARAYRPTAAPPPLQSADSGAGHVRGAGFGDAPRQLRAADFGVTLPSADRPPDDDDETRRLWRRQRVLLETLEALEEASATGRYHRQAQRNVQRWHEQAASSPPPAPVLAKTTSVTNGSGPGEPSRPSCTVLVRPGDWGEVTHALTKEFGTTFAALNMANAFGPGGGYTHGMVAQEENMFRRTDCHFALDRFDIDPTSEEYLPRMTSLLEAHDGRVYLDVVHPRVCVRGPERRDRADLGYEWLEDEEVFPFYELRAAAVDLRDARRGFSEEETARRVRAQLDTLAAVGVRHAVLAAFGCGAFLNPAARVAAVYAAELRRRAADFDVIAFAIFNAGYGPDNFAPFAAAFDSSGEHLPEMGSSSASVVASPPRSSDSAMPPPRPSKKSSFQHRVSKRKSNVGDD